MLGILSYVLHGVGCVCIRMSALFFVSQSSTRCRSLWSPNTSQSDTVIIQMHILSITRSKGLYNSRYQNASMVAALSTPLPLWRSLCTNPASSVGSGSFEPIGLATTGAPWEAWSCSESSDVQTNAGHCYPEPWNCDLKRRFLQRLWPKKSVFDLQRRERCLFILYLYVVDIGLDSLTSQPLHKEDTGFHEMLWSSSSRMDFDVHVVGVPHVKRSSNCSDWNYIFQLCLFSRSVGFLKLPLSTTGILKSNCTWNSRLQSFPGWEMPWETSWKSHCPASMVQLVVGLGLSAFPGPLEGNSVTGSLVKLRFATSGLRSSPVEDWLRP